MVTTTPHTGYFCESVEYKLTTLAPLVKGVQAPEPHMGLCYYTGSCV